MGVYHPQSASFGKVKIHIGKEFAPGQLYMALSRARTPEGLWLLGYNKKRAIPPPQSATTFYQEIIHSDKMPQDDLSKLQQNVAIPKPVQIA